VFYRLIRAIHRARAARGVQSPLGGVLLRSAPPGTVALEIADQSGTSGSNVAKVRHASRLVKQQQVVEDFKEVEVRTRITEVT
jgi:hypothetical protein